MRKLMWASAGVAGILTASFVFLIIAVGVTWHASAADPERPKWDQEEAVKRVQAVIAQEEAADFAWDNIEWNTDPAKALALAEKEQKPIFLYFFLKGNSGPAAAPC